MKLFRTDFLKQRLKITAILIIIIGIVVSLLFQFRNYYMPGYGSLHLPATLVNDEWSTLANLGDDSLRLTNLSSKKTLENVYFEDSDSSDVYFRIKSTEHSDFIIPETLLASGDQIELPELKLFSDYKIEVKPAQKISEEKNIWVVFR